MGKWTHRLSVALFVVATAGGLVLTFSQRAAAEEREALMCLKIRALELQIRLMGDELRLLRLLRR